MVGEEPGGAVEDPADRLPRREVAGLDLEVGHGSIEWFPFLDQGADGGERVRGLEQRPVGVAPDPIEDDCFRVCSQTTNPISCSRRWFSARSTTPPPVATTARSTPAKPRSTSVSSARNRSSPSCAKICGIDLPASRQISRSQSMNRKPQRRASSFPKVVFPVAMNPTNTMFLAPGTGRPACGAGGKGGAGAFSGIARDSKRG